MGFTPPIPRRDADATHIPEVAAITPEIEAMAGGSISGFGRGGMTSKLIAAKIATGAGCDVIIAKGENPHPVSAIAEGGAPHDFPRQPVARGWHANAGSLAASSPKAL